MVVCSRTFGVDMVTSRVARDRVELRRHAGHLNPLIIQAAPAPTFRRIIALDHWEPRAVKMSGGVTVRRAVAIDHAATDATETEVNPRIAALQACLTAPPARGDRADSIDRANH
jgi:hypothetical protein